MKAFFRRSRPSSEHTPPPSCSSSSALSNQTPKTPAPTFKPPPLTLIELFQSQSCSSCPPTNSLLLSLPSSQTSPSPNTLLLTHHVTYWNHLSWRDTFSLPEADVRQREYVQRMGLRGSYTPMVVVNGRVAGAGGRREELERLIQEGTGDRGEGQEKGEGGVVDIRVEDADEDRLNIRVSSPATTSSTPSLSQSSLCVSLILFSPSLTEVHVLSGENAGRVLPHRNVVRSILLLGNVEVGRELGWVVEKVKEGLRGVVIVQLGVGRPIVGAVLVGENCRWGEGERGEGVTRTEWGR